MTFRNPIDFEEFIGKRSLGDLMAEAIALEPKGKALEAEYLAAMAKREELTQRLCEVNEAYSDLKAAMHWLVDQGRIK